MRERDLSSGVPDVQRFGRAVAGAGVREWARQGAGRGVDGAAQGLQSQAGNRAVAHLLRGGAPARRRACPCSSAAGGACSGCPGREEEEAEPPQAGAAVHGRRLSERRGPPEAPGGALEAPLHRDGGGTPGAGPAPVTTPVEPVEPTPAQRIQIDAARRAAAVRTQIAMFKARGTHGALALREARNLARIKFDWADPNMEQIGEILGNMGGGLITVGVKVAGRRDPECDGRAGYVRGHRPPIVLCSSFFSSATSDESRIRTMIHEMAHVAGIGSATRGEQYFPVFDCDSRGSFDSADSWAHYVHCLSGQTPDQPDVIQAGP